MLKHIIGRFLRDRVVVHTRTGTSFLRDMEQYGVTVKNIPIDLGGAFLRAYYLVWLREHQERSVVVVPQPPAVDSEGNSPQNIARAA